MALSEDELESYASGKCMYLAAAIHRLTEWEIEATLTGSPSYIGHTWCKIPHSDQCIDIDGAYSMQNNGWIHPADEIRSGLDEDTLFHLVQSTSSNPFTREEWDDDVASAKEIALIHPPIAEPILRAITSQVRASMPSPGASLAGLCEPAADDLYELLQSHQIAVNLIHGTHPCSHPDAVDGRINHYWVEVGNYLLDPTAEQFSSPSPLITPKGTVANRYECIEIVKTFEPTLTSKRASMKFR